MTKVIFGRDAPRADPAIRKMKLRGASSVKFIPLRSIICISCVSSAVCIGKKAGNG